MRNNASVCRRRHEITSPLRNISQYRTSHHKTRHNLYICTTTLPTTGNMDRPAKAAAHDGVAIEALTESEYSESTVTESEGTISQLHQLTECKMVRLHLLLRLL